LSYSVVGGVPSGSIRPFCSFLLTIKGSTRIYTEHGRIFTDTATPRFSENGSINKRGFHSLMLHVDGLGAQSLPEVVSV